MIAVACIQGRRAARNLREVNFCCEWMTLARLKQLFSPPLYIYSDTWKALVINQLGLHVVRCAARQLRFWTCIAPLDVFPVGELEAANAESKNSRSAINTTTYNSRNARPSVKLSLFLTTPICCPFVSAVLRASCPPFQYNSFSGWLMAVQADFHYGPTV